MDSPRIDSQRMDSRRMGSQGWILKNGCSQDGFSRMDSQEWILAGWILNRRWPACRSRDCLPAPSEAPTPPTIAIFSESHIGHIGQSSVRSQNIKYGPKWFENRPFGPKQRPNEPNRLSGPIRTTPEAKNGPQKFLLKENGPRRPGRTSAAPPHSYWRRPGPM